MTDAEVARRLGLSQARYSSYTNGRREPDFRTLLRICEVLVITPDALFGVGIAGSENPRMGAAISALRTLNPETMEIAVALLDTLTTLPNGTLRRETPRKRPSPGARSPRSRG